MDNDELSRTSSLFSDYHKAESRNVKWQGIQMGIRTLQMGIPQPFFWPLKNASISNNMIFGDTLVGDCYRNFFHVWIPTLCLKVMTKSLFQCPSCFLISDGMASLYSCDPLITR